MRYKNTVTSLVLFLTACQAFSTKKETPIYYDIGAVHREITTTAAEAQLWFDRGLALCYGFNHEEAIACFDKALEADPQCAMAFWGKAYALGPNYNNTEISPDAWASAYASVQSATAAMAGCSEVDKGLIRALQTRYPAPGSTPLLGLDTYAQVMRELIHEHPNDADATALCAEALMQLNPWKLWSPEGVAAEGTAEIRKVLETGLARWPNHPALAHLYIHTMEAGPEVARAYPAAVRLETLTPGLGHLVHMPSHIYIWTGRYQDAIRVNQMAVEKDGAFVEHAGRNNGYTLYRVHNYHFITYGAMWDGQRRVAMDAARELVTEVPDELLASTIDLLDIFLATPMHVMVRFGMWEEILREPQPAATLLASRAVWRYARGIAYASLDRVEEAQQEQVAFLKAKAAVPASRMLFNNSVADILTVAKTILAGEIAYRRGNYTQAFRLLREAVALDLKMNYAEPWGWMEPARHALGALLTEQGRYQEASEVYRKNLDRYPENGWALHGLAECLTALGHAEEAANVKARFDKAWARADVQIPGSCFCRIGS